MALRMRRDRRIETGARDRRTRAVVLLAREPGSSPTSQRTTGSFDSHSPGALIFCHKTCTARGITGSFLAALTPARAVPILSRLGRDEIKIHELIEGAFFVVSERATVSETAAAIQCERRLERRT